MTDDLQLAKRLAVTSGAAAGLNALLSLIAEDEHAPTAVRDRLQGEDVHLADSLVGVEVPQLKMARSIADLGSGAGFPGIPLALVLPLAEVSLVESSVRKCAFLERAVVAAGAQNAAVVHSRAESWRAGIGGQDAVVIRALAPLAVLVEYAAPLLRIGGVLVAWKGHRDVDQEAAGARAAQILGLEPSAVLRVEPAVGLGERHLHIFTKATETPVRFPRRPGMALKRPLGG
ncbi:MAG: 16S rRNA (guanine(527)-N(7))-methyltransferase RsmG [Solirubrobacterales bacterium]|nr:16S rRNA (guanine(527)-N(7))-methyltransferase RsmG [Solirubrobacterales bacterium]